MNLERIKREVDFIKYVSEHYGIECDSRGNARCPFHPPDDNPSLSMFQDDDGVWRFVDHHVEEGIEGRTGTIVDFVALNEKIAASDACKKLLKEFEPQERAFEDNLQRYRQRKRSNSPSEATDTREHIYRDVRGIARLKKVKTSTSSGEESWKIYHKTGNTWRLGKGPNPAIPYNLDKFKDKYEIVISEGEKDSDTLTELTSDVAFTSAPYGKGNWPDSLTPYFSLFRKITFLYDVGNENFAKRHAQKLLNAFQDVEVFLARVPMEENEADVTDYLNLFTDNEIKLDKFNEILEAAERVEPTECEANSTGSRVYTLREFREKEIPAREVIFPYHAEKKAVTILAGVHKKGKSIYCMQMGMSAADGRSFLNFETPGSSRVLYIQQEISEPSMQERLEKLIHVCDRYVMENFMIKNTCGNMIKIDNRAQRLELYAEIADCHPDLIIFDPFSTFHTGKENDESEMSKLMDYFYEIAHRFECGVFLVHHYGKPSLADRQGGHLLRGHSVLGDRPDIIINFNSLPKRYQNSPLPLPQNHYAEVAFLLRNDAAPSNIIIERDLRTLWYREYDLYNQLGRRILPERVRHIVQENEGEMPQKDLLTELIQLGSRTIAFRAIKEAEEKGYIERSGGPGRGSPKVVKLKAENESS
jgi:hypothetical protein